jgi:predicted transcriptional regulator
MLDQRLDRTALLTVRPRFATALIDGTKTVEIRRRRAHLRRGEVCLLYASSPTRAIVGAIRVAGVDTAPPYALWLRWGHRTGLSRPEFDGYLDGRAEGCAILVDAILALEQAIPLSELRRRRPSFSVPQSYRFLPVQELACILNGESEQLALLRQRTPSAGRVAFPDMPSSVGVDDVRADVATRLR